jgi:hypothetical protein
MEMGEKRSLGWEKRSQTQYNEHMMEYLHRVASIFCSDNEYVQYEDDATL